MSTNEQFTTITLNPDHIVDLEDFEERRVDAWKAQRDGQDPDFESLLTQTEYQETQSSDDGAENAYDVVTNKWLAQEIDTADDSLEQAKNKLRVALGGQGIRYEVNIDTNGSVVNVTKIQELGKPSKAHVARQQRVQEKMRTGVTTINTSKYIAPFRDQQ